ncbi:hypothetical protein UlMin_004402 [Ulmus minor]
MDSSSSHPNWLAFSLSNHPHLSLFHPFSSSNSARVVDTTGQEDLSTGATDLAIFTGGAPKLEDFLGGCGTGSTVHNACPPPLAAQFSNQTTVTIPNAEIYDSELKTIAASFLRGFNSSEQIETLNRQAPVTATAVVAAEPATKKTVDTFGQRTSIYRGVTRHRWTGRYEAHLWDNSCRREGQSRKGRQVYLGGYDKEEKAARAYDLAALKYWGPTTTTNFPVSNYEKELEEMKNMTRQEFVASLRRKSSGFSRGASIYRGVTRHHQHGRWQARIGRVAGNKDLYLGTFSTQEEAAEAYDIAAIKFRGLNAVTNFDMSRYDVKSIANSNLPIGGTSTKSNKSESHSDTRSVDEASSVSFASQPNSSTLSFAIPIKQDPSPDYWSNILGYQNKNTSNNNSYNNPTATYLHSSSLPFNMDFSTSTSSTSASDQNNSCFYNYPNNQQQQQPSTTGLMPFASPIVVNSNNGYESWNIGSTLHTFQAHHAKPSLFQTPIFGME